MYLYSHVNGGQVGNLVSLLFLNQHKPLDTHKHPISHDSGSTQLINPSCSIYVQTTRHSCTEFTRCTTLYHLVRNISSYLLKDANLSLTNFLSNRRRTQLFNTERTFVITQQQFCCWVIFYPINPVIINAAQNDLIKVGFKLYRRR